MSEKLTRENSKIQWQTKTLNQDNVDKNTLSK